jgi:hypothetical protein
MGAVSGRRVILGLGVVLWATITVLTLYVLVTNGPDVLVLASLLVVAVLGAGVFGSLVERR